MEPLTGFILNELKNLVVVVNPQGKIKYVNKYTHDLLGISTSTTNLFEYRHSIEKAKTITTEIVEEYQINKTKSASGFEKPLLTYSGHTLWIMWNVTQDQDGNMIGIGYDITEKKTAELQLKEKALMLEERQNDVISSIQYAQRIQEALLPDLEKLKKYFSGVMGLYKPRDFVSGDFYWITKKENYLFIAVGDCTGHGVPGAMMSVMGNSLLNNVIKKHGVLTCDEILRELDRELHLCLNHKSYGTRDGMDLSLLRIDVNTMYAQYCGAMRGALLLRNQEIHEIKASKYPLGFYDDVPKYFENINWQMQKGDKFYMFTDGYCHQFGGDNNKKFNKKNFKELLLSLNDMPMSDQEHYLDYVFQNWKQKNPQTDDVTVVGISI